MDILREEWDEDLDIEQTDWVLQGEEEGIAFCDLIFKYNDKYYKLEYRSDNRVGEYEILSCDCPEVVAEKVIRIEWFEI